MRPLRLRLHHLRPPPRHPRPLRVRLPRPLPDDVARRHRDRSRRAGGPGSGRRGSGHHGSGGHRPGGAHLDGGVDGRTRLDHMGGDPGGQSRFRAEPGPGGGRGVADGGRGHTARFGHRAATFLHARPGVSGRAPCAEHAADAGRRRGADARRRRLGGRTPGPVGPRLSARQPDRPGRATLRHARRPRRHPASGGDRLAVVGTVLRRPPSEAAGALREFVGLFVRVAYAGYQPTTAEVAGAARAAAMVRRIRRRSRLRSLLSGRRAEHGTLEAS